MTVEKYELDSLGIFSEPLKGLIMGYIHEPRPLKNVTYMRLYGLFKEALPDAVAAWPLLTDVVLANPDALIPKAQADWELFFKKGEVTDPSGQIFYDVSSYQLMNFLCDKDMIAKVMRLMPAAITKTRGNQKVTLDLQALRKAQNAEIDSGGADLVKLGRDPMKLPFVEVTRFVTSVTIDNQQKEVVFPLLENTDGIIFYHDTKTQVMHLYYANKTTQTVALIELSQEQRQRLDSLFASFTNMENNSSRRSSNAEHALIKHTIQRSLSRKGIVYSDPNGVHYQDSRMEFRCINSLRKCLRLDTEGLYADADEVWRSGVGWTQRQVFWLLQRICEKRPFYPLPKFYDSPFHRCFIIFNWLADKDESVFSGGRLSDDFGSEFAIYKSLSQAGAAGPGGSLHHARTGLVATNWLVEDAKAFVVEFTADKTQSADVSVANQSPGLG
jgi:hypothetical protein